VFLTLSKFCHRANFNAKERFCATEVSSNAGATDVVGATGLLVFLVLLMLLWLLVLLVNAIGATATGAA
jgi:hypothetical protein